MKGGRVTGLRAASFRSPAAHRTGTRTVTVGSDRVSIALGQKSVTVGLNSTSRSLLARFGQLPATLGVFEVLAGSSKLINAAGLTVTST